MIARLILITLFCLGLVCLSQQPQAQIGTLGCGAVNQKALAFQPCGVAGSGPPPFTPSCSQSSAYIFATSLTVTEKPVIDTLICGRVTSGVFAKMDVWNFLALTNKADAMINMAQPGTFNTTEIGAPTFTANRGYAGVDASTTVALNTHLNPSVGTPKYGASGGTTGHLSFWSNTNHQPATNTVDIGMDDSGAANNSFVSAQLASNNADFIVNSTGFSGGVVISDSLGHYLANRSSTTVVDAYKNATNVGSLSQPFATVANGEIYVLALNVSTGGSGSVSNGSVRQIMSFSIGGTLTAGDVTDLCHATNVALTALGGVAGGTC